MKNGKITGNDLIEMGYTPGKWFGEALKHINDTSLRGDAIVEYMESIKPPPKIKPYTLRKDYHENLKPTNDLERSNLIKVRETMNEVMKTPTVVDGAIMPDACPAGSVGNIPVGGVVKTKNAIHPSMHSADICCSVMMSEINDVDPEEVLDVAEKTTHFGFGGRFDGFDLPKDLESKIKSNSFLNDDKSLELANSNLGTQGDGNHFLFVGVGEKSNKVSIVTHHGSRGFGARLFKKGMRLAKKFKREISPETMDINAWIPYDTKLGKQYWEALQIVREWTKLNHYLIHEAISEKLGRNIILNMWNEHNFVFKDGDYFYHGKGATPLSDKFVPDGVNGLRLIPLNMNEPILVVMGGENENNLGFAPHGAGRNMSRTKHKKLKSDKTDVEIFKEETLSIDVRFKGDIDISELPSAYKDAISVESQMKDFGLGEVVDRIMPYGSIMAGDMKKFKNWSK